MGTWVGIVGLGSYQGSKETLAAVVDDLAAILGSSSLEHLSQGLDIHSPALKEDGHFQVA